MARRTNLEIVKKHLILCEGTDAENFLIYYLESDALADKNAFANEYQVMDFGGNTALESYLANLRNMSGFDKVRSILIIRDAEKDVDKAIREIKNALRKIGLPIPNGPNELVFDGNITIGFSLFPTCNKDAIPGTLEDLCMKILSEESVERVLFKIDEFLEILKKEGVRSFPREFKAKLHTYFSVTNDYVSLKIGEAASAGAFDWYSDNLEPLKTFIESAMHNA